MNRKKDLLQSVSARKILSDEFSATSIRGTAKRLMPLRDLEDSEVVSWLEKQFQNQPEKIIIQLITPAKSKTPGNDGSGGDVDQDQEDKTRTKDKHWIELLLVDHETSEPVAGVKATLTLPTGEKRTMTSNSAGKIRIDGLPDGTYDLEELMSSDMLEIVSYT